MKLHINEFYWNAKLNLLAYSKPPNNVPCRCNMYVMQCVFEGWSTNGCLKIHWHLLKEFLTHTRHKTTGISILYSKNHMRVLSLFFLNSSVRVCYDNRTWSMQARTRKTSLVIHVASCFVNLKFWGSSHQPICPAQKELFRKMVHKVVSKVFIEISSN